MLWTKQYWNVLNELNLQSESFSHFATSNFQHLFSSIIFSTFNIVADKVQLSLLFLFVAWLAVISSVCWLCAMHASKVLASEKNAFKWLIGYNEAISWLRVEKNPPPSFGHRPVPALKSAKSFALRQVPVKHNYRESAWFGLSSSSSGGLLLKAHSPL